MTQRSGTAPRRAAPDGTTSKDGREVTCPGCRVALRAHLLFDDAICCDGFPSGLAHGGLTATEIADVSGLYSGHGRADRCFDDLKALAKNGWLTRCAGRPARWDVPSDADAF